MSTVNKQCLLHRRRFAVATCYSSKTLEMALQVIRLLERANNPSDDFDYLSANTKFGGPAGTNDHRTQAGRIATLALWLGPDLSTWAQGPHPCDPRVLAAFRRYGVSDRMEDEMYQVGMRPSVGAPTHPMAGGAPAAPDVPPQQMLPELTPPPPANAPLSDFIGHSQQMIQDALKNRTRESANAKANEEQKARESKKALDQLAKFEANLKRIADDEAAKKAKAAEAAEKKKAADEAAAAKNIEALKAIAEARAAQDKEAKRAAEKKAREEKQAADAAAEKARQAAAEEEKRRMLAENAEQERLAAERKQLEAKQAAEEMQRRRDAAKKARELTEQKLAEAAAALAAERERLKQMKEKEQKAAEEKRQQERQADEERRAAAKKAREEKQALEKKQAEEQREREAEERRKRDEEAKRAREQEEAKAKIIRDAEEAKRLADAAERKRIADQAAERQRQQEAERQRQLKEAEERKRVSDEAAERQRRLEDELKGQPSQEPENPPPQRLSTPKQQPARTQTIGASIFGNVLGFFGFGGGGDAEPQAEEDSDATLRPPPQNAAAALPKRAGTFTAPARPEPVEAEEESPSSSRESTPLRPPPPPPTIVPPPQAGRPGRAGTLVSHAPRPQGSRVVRSNTMRSAAAPLLQFKGCRGQVVVAKTTSGNVTFGVLKEPNGELKEGDAIGAKQWMYVGQQGTVISKEKGIFIAYAYSLEDLKPYGFVSAGKMVTSDLNQIFAHFARL